MLSLVDEFKALSMEIQATTGCPMPEAIREATTTLYDLLCYYEDYDVDSRVPASVLRAVETWQEEVPA